MWDLNATLWQSGSEYELDIGGTGEMVGYYIKSPEWSSYKPNITSVKIKSGVTSIGFSAFKDCTNLESAIIADGVTSIDSAAFKGCVSLKSVVLPKTLEKLGNVFVNSPLETVFYSGTKSDWNAMTISTEQAQQFSKVKNITTVRTSLQIADYTGTT